LQGEVGEGKFYIQFHPIMIASLHADLVSQKTSCTDLITKHLTQATLNTYNANISILHKQALDAAALVDAKIARGE
jgi:aspartyl-tRNA(Asn)/glutamyl-tRNA(Gln) amidotransferase subunit A